MTQFGNKANVLENKTAQLAVCYGGYSCAGIKTENQDAFAMSSPSSNDVAQKGIIACIADGVSSANKAADASQLAVTQFITDFYATPPTWSTKKSAGKVLNSLNQWLYSQGNNLHLTHGEPNEKNMEHQQWFTTFSTLILKSATGYIFHVGDTRITKYYQGELEAISNDHNCSQGGHGIILTRALGADSRLQVDVHQVNLVPGEVYLLTCDGVHEYVPPKTIKALLSELPEEPDNKLLEKLSKKIVQQALKNGSNDNVSCLLVYIQSIPSKNLHEIERELLSKAIPPALKVNQKLDGYVVKKIIHASTRSHLYLVQPDNPPDKDSNMLFTLKAPSLNFSDDSLYLQGFVREAWLGQQIAHNHIMSIKKPKKNQQFLYHICEYIDGQTLGQWMIDNPKPSLDKVRDIIRQIISALRAFQRLEVVHRDLKPDNIMIDEYGQIKLIDYGTVLVGSLSENADTLPESVPQGSVNYIAPETLASLKSDYLSDLFSLAVISYELLTGELPYKPQQNTETNFNKAIDYNKWQYRSIRQLRPELPVWLDLTLQHATSADPKKRYQAYSEFYADLSKPNIDAIEGYKSKPLIQRDPVQFWQGVSLILFICTIAALVN